MINKFLIVMFAALLLQSCATSETSSGAMCEKESAMIADADKARKKAKSVGGEWRDIGKFLKKAKAAVKKGKCGKAAKLAKKAHKQGDMGYAQAMKQKDTYMPGYFKF